MATPAARMSLHAVQALTVAFTYDTGRALALLARAGHRSRRSAEH